MNRIILFLISIALLMATINIIKLDNKIKTINNLLNIKETKEGIKYIEAEHKCIRIGEK